MTPGILDLNNLSEEARREVVDFYEFVKTKYSIKAKSKGRDLSRLIPRKVPAFIPLSREQAHER
jgi:hypothetical protein